MEPQSKEIEPRDLEEYRRFRAAWFSTRDNYLAHWGIIVGGVVNSLGLGALYFYGAANPQLLIAGHGTLEAGIVLWLVLSRFVVIASPRIWALFGEVALAAIYGFNLHVNVVNGAGTNVMITSASAYFGMTMIFTLMLPARSWTRGIVALFYIGLGVWAWNGHPVTLKWSFLHAMLVTAVWSFAVLMDERTNRETRREFHARKTFSRFEKLEREKDMLFAREVQQSLLPPESLSYGAIELRCYQAKQETVCGDWLGVKSLGAERAIAIVVDASGKGVHAALVVQAVQTLFVDIADDAPFAPEAWIRKVNTVLRRLGAKSVQTVTLGLLDIDHRTVTYWSAGHIPLMLRSAEVYPERRGSSRLAVARGDVLGVSEVPTLMPHSVVVPDDAAMEVMLGSDGIFTKGTRYSDAEIAKLFDELAKEGAGFVALPWSADDRSLIHVRLKPALAAAVA